jgi:hypothetical protein
MTTRAAGDLHGQAFRDARHASRERIWSGEPNPRLVAEARARVPSTTRTAGR